MRRQNDLQQWNLAANIGALTDEIAYLAPSNGISWNKPISSQYG